MAQQDVPAPAKLTPKTLIGLLLACGGVAGADAAGYTPDFETLKSLGLVGAIAIIAYLHYVILPVFMRLDLRLSRIETRLGAEPDLELERAPEPIKRTGTGPVLRVATVPPKE